MTTDGTVLRQIPCPDGKADCEVYHVEKVADHPWRTYGANAGWSANVYPLGLVCPRDGLGLDKHPIQSGHVLPSGVLDAALE
jgi:hypothetical protein